MGHHGPTHVRVYDQNKRFLRRLSLETRESLEGWNLEKIAQSLSTKCDKKADFKSTTQLKKPFGKGTYSRIGKARGREVVLSRSPFDVQHVVPFPERLLLDKSHIIGCFPLGDAMADGRIKPVKDTVSSPSSHSRKRGATHVITLLPTATGQPHNGHTS